MSVNVNLRFACQSKVFFFVPQNTQVTEAWNKIAQSFKCSPIEGECPIKWLCLSVPCYQSVHIGMSITVITVSSDFLI